MNKSLLVLSFFPAFCLDFVECTFKIKCKKGRVNGRLSGERKNIYPGEKVRKECIEPSVKRKKRDCKY